MFTLDRGTIIWRSIKQSYIANSTIEVKYVTACEAAKEAVWQCKFLMDLEVVPTTKHTMTLYLDNNCTIANPKELESQKRGKHT